MKLEDIFTAEELALIDAGKYRPGRKTLDAKLDLWAALEREACAELCKRMAKRTDDIRSAALEMAAENIRARGQA